MSRSDRQDRRRQQPTNCAQSATLRDIKPIVSKFSDITRMPPRWMKL
jgi:hypothetical protein